MNPPASDVSAPLLAGHRLACERDGRLLFSGLDLRLQSGELLQLEGPNGAGKTSLMRMLAGLLPLTEGELSWRGQPLPQCRDALLQATLFIGHLAGIKVELTPLENLAWYAALDGISDAGLLEQALQQVGLAGYEDHPCHQLSAGQRRRVALARLLISPRPLWLLDEPFTALDKQAVAAIETLLIQHAAAGGAAILTSHHALDALPRLSQIHLGKLA